MNNSYLMDGFSASTRWGIIIVDSDGTVELVNPAAAAILGYESDELVGQAITIIIPTRLRGAHTSGMARAVESGDSKLAGKTVEVSALRKDGSEVPIEMTLSVWTDGGLTWAGAMINDISERRARNSRLLRLATRDTLTGLQNKSAFKEGVADAMSKGPTTLFLLSLDGLREVDDLVGRVMADSSIQAAGVRLTYLVGEGLSVARLRADEFGLVFPGGARSQTAEALAAKLIDAFIKPFSLGGMEFQLNLSIGIAISNSQIADAEELLAAADFALQKVKSCGGRRFRLFNDAMRQESETNRITRDQLRKGLHNNQLKLFYQPQFELFGKRLVGFEALIRWQHPVRGLLMPATFLPALDRVL